MSQGNLSKRIRVLYSRSRLHRVAPSLRLTLERWRKIQQREAKRSDFPKTSDEQKRNKRRGEEAEKARFDDNVERVYARSERRNRSVDDAESVNNGRGKETIKQLDSALLGRRIAAVDRDLCAYKSKVARPWRALKLSPLKQEMRERGR